MRFPSLPVALGFIVVAGAVGAAVPRFLNDGSSLYARAQRLSRDQRPFEARLSGSEHWRPCALRADSLEIACDEYAVDEPIIQNAQKIARVAQADARRANYIDTAAALATIDLLGAPTGTSVAKQVERLERVVARSGNDASLRNDLAVAYLARGGSENLFLALEQIERAFAIDSGSAVIGFNRALILTRLHLSMEARTAWETYIRQHRRDDWAKEAKIHLREVQARLEPRTFDRGMLSQAGESTRDPQAAREYALDSLLGRWAQKRSIGARAAADSACGLMTEVAQQLAERSGDASVASVAVFCERDRLDVARATVNLAQGDSLYRDGKFKAATQSLAPVVTKLRSVGALPIASWAEVRIAFAEIYQGDYEKAEALFAHVEHEAGARGDSALRARALWGMALSLGRRGRTASAADDYSRAADIYHRLGERVNEGAMLAQCADVLLLLARDQLALSYKHRAFALIDSGGRRPALRFVSLGLSLSDIGLPAAAAAAFREGVDAARVSDRASEVPEALVNLASAEASLGELPSAHVHLSAAREAIRKIDDPVMLARQNMTLAMTLATFDSLEAADSAIARLTEVERYYSAMNLEYNRALPLIRRARLLWRRGDVRRAKLDAEAAAAAVERQTTKTSDPTALRDRAAARREVFETLVGLNVRTGDAVGAFLAAERARGNHLANVPRAPNGRTILSYFALSNSTVLWIVSSRGLRMVVTPLGINQLRDKSRRAEELVAQGEESPEWRSVSRELFDLLLQPAARELDGAKEVVIVPDGPLGRLPFGALQDSAGRYLVERVVPIYSEMVRASSPSVSNGSPRAFVVGSPAIDRRLFADLGELAGASDEVSAVRQLNRTTQVIEGEGATRNAVLRGLATAELFHFAGHARLVPGAPSSSYLVLAKTDTGGFGANVLSASDIAALDLHRMSLVILSACGTQQARSNRDAGQSGLSQAFFAAGAKAVISSRWEADDAGTAELMRLVYDGLHNREAPAAALAHAQAKLRKSEVVGRPLRVWGAFMYEER